MVGARSGRRSAADDRGATVSVTVLGAPVAPPRAAWLGLVLLALLACVVVPATADDHSIGNRSSAAVKPCAHESDEHEQATCMLHGAVRAWVAISSHLHVCWHLSPLQPWCTF